ncbi:MAG TPA: PIN domain-containing protein [Candidatus Acidoferrum sp.]|nr:PIN domain-containing protein [Candidatus Acidoferrum sp.]
MAADALVDTGAILAVLDKSDVWHSACRSVFEQIRVPLLTSQAVLTELFHLLGRWRQRKEAAWNLILSGSIVVCPIGQMELPNVHELMMRYSDLPMDFADATLVYLAGRESISTIVTVDQKHFATYRIGGKGRFRVLPVDRP